MQDNINFIYLHIPFCLKKCNYCAFCSYPLLNYENIYIDKLEEEINHFYQNNPIETLYFGGGTPSLLNIKNIERLINKFNFKKNPEITLEMNPFNISKEKVKNLKNIGINRISLGVQSFNDDILKAIGRNHSKKDIFNTIDYLNKAGFENFSIDLIYGLPNQDINNWKNTLNTALLLNPKHISLYGLKIEKGTYFYKNPPKNIADNDIQAFMYELAMEKLSESYSHYEFAAFAKDENYFSRHNLCYWKRKNYFGFGLSASGFIENKRYTNTFNFKKYLEKPTKKDYTILSKCQEIEEEIFLGLRLADGIEFEKYEKNKDFKAKFEKYISLGFMEKIENKIKLTKKGILVSNEILCDFIEA